VILLSVTLSSNSAAVYCGFDREWLLPEGQGSQLSPFLFPGYGLFDGLALFLV
jgi:hypothetical protein